MSTTTLSTSRIGFFAITAAALAASAALPVLVHLLPAGASGPIGPRLLPIFFAPLIAVLMGRPGVALIVAALAPSTNHLLTGSPAPAMLATLTLQLLLFASVLTLLRKPARLFLPLIAPLAYLGAVLAVPHLLGFLTGFPWLSGLAVIPAPPAGALLLQAWPGLLVIALITLGMNRTAAKA